MSPTLFRVAADLVTVLHLLFVVFVAAGGLLVLWRPRIALAHLPAVAWGIWVEMAGWICPLTYVENWLRTAAGDQGYTGGFVERYVVAVLYPDGLTRDLQLVLAGTAFGINLLVYAWIWSRRRAARSTSGVRAGQVTRGTQLVGRNRS